MSDLIERDALLQDMGLTDAVKYGNKTAEQQYRSYSTWMSYEIADSIWDAPAVNRWIPCSERFPEKNCRVLVSTEYKTICIAYYSNEQWYPDGYKGAIFSPSYVLAWMPMPDAYKPPEREV